MHNAFPQSDSTQMTLETWVKNAWLEKPGSVMSRTAMSGRNMREELALGLCFENIDPQLQCFVVSVIRSDQEAAQF